MIGKDVRKKIQQECRTTNSCFFYQNQYLTTAFWPKTIPGHVRKEATNKAYLQWPVGPKYKQKTETTNLLKILRDNQVQFINYLKYRLVGFKNNLKERQSTMCCLMGSGRKLPICLSILTLTILIITASLFQLTQYIGKQLSNKKFGFKSPVQIL